MTVKTIHSPEEFAREKQAAGDKLVAVDFTASWCGPCQTISPVFHRLSGQYPNVVFLSVDVDEVSALAQSLGVRAMPTFHFYKSGQKVDEFTGANAARLEELIKKHQGGSAGSSADSDSGVAGMSDISGLIDQRQSHCLNENQHHTLKGMLAGNGRATLESDADEQLLIELQFTQPVRVHSIKLTAKDTESAPKGLKVFANRVNLGFDSAESLAAEQELDLPASTDEQLIGLKFVKFQRVNTLALFVSTNHGADVTRIANLRIIGTAVDATDMNNFKRVAGEKGEAE